MGTPIQGFFFKSLREQLERWYAIASCEHVNIAGSYMQVILLR